MYQLRIYTIKSKEAGEQYLNVHWKRHLVSLPKYGIEVDGVFGEVSDNDTYRVIALCHYEDGADIEALNKAYMTGPDLRADMEGFPLSMMAGVETINMDCPDYFPFPQRRTE